MVVMEGLISRVGGEKDSCPLNYKEKCKILNSMVSAIESKILTGQYLLRSCQFMQRISQTCFGCALWSSGLGLCNQKA